jgi:hypothetical protein
MTYNVLYILSITTMTTVNVSLEQIQLVESKAISFKDELHSHA